MTQRSFLHGAFVLIAASLVTRVMGFAYRIFLTRLIGAEGLGLFQFVWPILSLVLTLVTAGLPVAISKLVAEALVERDKVRISRILRVSTSVIATMAVVCTALMWFLRGFVATHWLSDPRAYPTYLAMIPIVSVISISSIYRGYFQGLQDMAPPAWASICEQTIRIISIWLMASYMIRYSLAYAAATAMVGMLLGELAGLIWLIIAHRRRGRLAMLLPDARAHSLETTTKTLHAIAQVAVPVTISRLIGTAIFAVEPVLVTRSLVHAGIAAAATTGLYGEYSGMAWPLLIFPTVFTSSLAINLVPSVSEAVAGDARGRIRVRLSQSWRATALVGFPTSVVLTLFATPLCRMLYHQPSVGPMLAIMAPAGFLLYLQAPLSGILQGLNRAGLAMMSSFVGGIVRLGLIYEFGGQPQFGILGVAFASTLSVCLTTALYFGCVYYFVGFPIRIADTAKIAICALLMLVVMDSMTHHNPSAGGWQVTGAITAGFTIFFVLACMMRVLTTTTVRRVPKIGRWLAEVVKVIPFAA